MCDEGKDELDKTLDAYVTESESEFVAFEAKINNAIDVIYKSIIQQMLRQLPDDTVEVAEYNFEECKKLNSPLQQRKILAVMLKSYHQDAIKIDYRRKYNSTQTRGILEVAFPENEFTLVKEAIYMWVDKKNQALLGFLFCKK